MNWLPRPKNSTWAIEVGQITVIYDACILYPAPLRDLLMHMAMTDLYRAKWTEAIHDEWTRNLLNNRRDLRPEQLQRARELMNAQVRDCLVTGYESLIDAVRLPDLDDRHVLAAAIRSNANFIVTFNLHDFPVDALEPFGIEAVHPMIFWPFNSKSPRISFALPRSDIGPVSETLPRMLMSILPPLRLRACYKPHQSFERLAS